MEQPPYFDKNYTLVHEKIKSAKIWTEKPKKSIPKTNLSPASYNIDESFKST